MSIINNDINQLERFLDGGANALIQVVTAVVTVGAVFFYLSPPIALMAFTPIPVIIIGAIWFQRQVTLVDHSLYLGHGYQLRPHS